jgi:protein-L-isoaspartate(D-aspartate) O-methyltransferase
MTSRRTRQRLVQRLRAAGIGNEAVLEVILNIPRHLFVEEALAGRAYEETALPIGFGQTISQPYIVALMTEALLDGRSPRKVLEVGTGSAYQTAVLAALVEQVYSIERIGWLLDKARERLQALAIGNVELKHDNGALGWPEYAPYNGIIVTAASGEIPDALLAQLSVGGRLVMPVGPPNTQELLSVERRLSGFERQVLSLVSFVPLLEGVL